MKVTFSQILKSEAYQKQAELFAKADIFLAVVTLVWIGFIGEQTFSIWRWIIGYIWGVLGVSLLVALPYFLAVCFFASILSGNAKYPKPWPRNFLGFIAFCMAKIVLPLLSGLTAIWSVHKVMGVE